MRQCRGVGELVVAISSGHEQSSSPSSVHGVASSFASLEASSSTLSSELVVDLSSTSLDHEVEQSSTITKLWSCLTHVCASSLGASSSLVLETLPYIKLRYNQISWAILMYMISPNMLSFIDW